MTPLAAMQVFHEFLRRVKDTPYKQRPTDFQRAWAASTGCNLELLYREHLSEQNEKSHSHVWTWFEIVCRELLAAREYFARSRAGGAVNALTAGRSGGASAVATVARQLHVPKSTILALKNKQTPRAGGREFPGDRVMPSGGHKRPADGAAAAAEPPTKAGRPAGRRQQPSGFVNREMAFPAHCRLDALANLVLGERRYTSLEDLERALGPRSMAGGARCLLCGKTGHLLGQRACEARQRASPAIQQAAEAAWTERLAIRRRETDARKAARQAAAVGGTVAAATGTAQPATGAAADVNMADA